LAWVSSSLSRLNAQDVNGAAGQGNGAGLFLDYWGRQAEAHPFLGLAERLAEACSSRVPARRALVTCDLPVVVGPSHLCNPRQDVDYRFTSAM
jgi:hypothetical protein